MIASFPTGDAPARRRIRESLDESLIVEAAAGTGKTSELVRRITGVLRTGRAQVENIVAVTFTRKAAGELKLRLRQALDEAREQATSLQESDALDRAVSRLEEARIGTIDAFCAQILRERPVEAGVDPEFRVLSERDQSLFRLAFRRWLERHLAAQGAGLRRAIERCSANWNESPVARQLEVAAWKLADQRDSPAPWDRPADFDLARSVSGVLDLLRRLTGLLARASHPKDNLVLDLRPATELMNWIDRGEVADPIVLEGRFLQLNRELGRGKKRTRRGLFGDGVARQDVIEARDRLLFAIDELSRRGGADLAVSLREEMADLLEDYERIKREHGCLDFLDIQMRVRDLITGNGAVRSHLQKRFTHLFIDEFQDTDPLQAQILILLSASDPEVADWTSVTPEPGKLFLVGDPKQSIYRFRRADVILYQQIRSTLVTRGVGLVCLGRSYRSVRPIQQAVNLAFRHLMTGDELTGQPDYVALEKDRDAIEGQPSIVVLPVPEPYSDWGNLTRGAIAESLPDAVGAFIHWLLAESGWRVSDLQGVRPVEPHDVCILFRRLASSGGDVSREYAAALETRGVPYVLHRALHFHSREEVESIRVALTAIEWPDDELSVYATLRGPLLAIPDELLLRYRDEHQALRPLRIPEPVRPEFEAVAWGLSLLSRLHRKRNRQPVVATLSELLEATRAHAGFALRLGGNQVLANVYRVCDLARNFEIGGGLSFRGFVEEMIEQAGAGESAESTALEEGAGGVRLMTVHQAKGLEFPIVVLADLSCNMTHRDPDQHTDRERNLCAMRLIGCLPQPLADNLEVEQARDQAEAVRSAYVAATRARDLLVIPALGEQEWKDGWLSPLNPAIYPDSLFRYESERAAGCPEFGPHSVISAEPRSSVRPGWHDIAGYGVVWWDPSVLRLNASATSGLRRSTVLADDGGSGAAQAGKDAFRAWMEHRASAIERGCIPTVHPFLATQAEADPPGEFIPVAFESCDRAAGRPEGRRFGTLVHAVLAEIPFDASEEDVRARVAFQSRLTGSPPEEVSAATGACRAVLTHPLVRRAAASPHCRREWPLTFRLPGSQILEGVIDLAFEENGQWMVVDFKTDPWLAPETRERYERQVRWYVHALRQMSGKPASGALLLV